MPSTRTSSSNKASKIGLRATLAAYKPKNVKARFSVDGKIGGEKERAASLALYNPNAPILTSVVIPVYNTEDYLAMTLDSVLSQTQAQIEVLLIDDGSTDGSLAIEREYAERDPRVRVLTQPNLRQGAARNRGLAEARGEFVYFMDSDDLITTDLFETCYEACASDSLDFAVFDTAVFKGKPSYLRPDLAGFVSSRRGIAREDVCDGVTFWNELFERGKLVFLCWLQYIRKDFLLANDLRFVEGIYFEDNDWIVRLYLAAERIRFIPQTFHRYRLRPNSNVASGFKPELADSCPDVHRILCNLVLQENEKARMALLENAHYILDKRFEELEVIEPDEALAAKIQAFAEEICVGFGDQEVSHTLRRWHLQTLAALCRGTTGWPSFDIAPIRRGMLDALVPDAPEGFAAGKLGVCGTASECARLLKAFDTERMDVTVFLTDEEEHGWPAGVKALPVGRCAEAGCEAVLFAGPSPDDALVESVEASLGGFASTYRVTQSVKELRWADIPDVMKARP